MRKIVFLTIGDISKIATMKRALGMAGPLQKLGWDVSIIAMDCEENRKRISMECDSTIAIKYYQDTSVLKEAEDKTVIVNQIKPDFIYICSYSIRNRVIRNKLTCRPKLLIEHSELPSAIKDASLKKNVLSYYLEVNSVFYSQGLICASKYLYNYYKAKLAFLGRREKPIIYSPYAFSEDIANYPKRIFSSLKEKYNRKEILVYMGTMARNYGLFTMLESMRLLSKGNRPIKLLILGKGRHLEEARNFVLKNNLQDHVEFLGYVPEEDVTSYLALADAFISPLNDTVQDWARCPSKIYMYLPFNKPVLTCEIGEAKEIFGDKGYYFDNSRPCSLADLIGNIMDKKYIHQKIDVSQHTWSKRAEELHNWLNINFT